MREESISNKEMYQEKQQDKQVNGDAGIATPAAQARVGVDGVATRAGATSWLVDWSDMRRP